MVFSSLIFLYAFLPLSLIAYKLAKGVRGQNRALLVFSLIFYAWGEPKYVLLLMFMALSSWFCALRVEGSRRDREARFWVFLSSAVDLLLIGFFKYAGFFCSIFHYSSPFISSIALPLGISFYTFQLMTYVIDVYRGEAPAQKSYGDVLLYAALFHQCIAGPIVRYKTVSQELFVRRDSTYTLLPGIRRFTVGLAKKTLLANPCGALADSLFLAPAVASDASLYSQNLEALKGLTVSGSWLGLLAFSLQIYLDFSAYSDMAIGLGKMIGLNYSENFDYPYISRSVTEFWRRWHISLGTFFRDYVYIPLGGSRCSRARGLFNALVVWLLTGLWHGASWNFVLWGLYFFVFLMLERLFLSRWLKRSHFFSRVYLLLVVCLGWVLFHFTDIRLGLTVFRNLLGLNGNAFTDMISRILLQNNAFLLLASVLACTPVFRRMGEKLETLREVPGLSVLYHVAADCVLPIALLLLATCCLVGDSYNPFIYFQF